MKKRYTKNFRELFHSISLPSTPYFPPRAEQQGATNIIKGAYRLKELHKKPKENMQMRLTSLTILLFREAVSLKKLRSTWCGQKSSLNFCVPGKQKRVRALPLVVSCSALHIKRKHLIQNRFVRLVLDVICHPFQPTWCTLSPKKIISFKEFKMVFVFGGFWGTINFFPGGGVGGKKRSQVGFFFAGFLTRLLSPKNRTNFPPYRNETGVFFFFFGPRGLGGGKKKKNFYLQCPPKTEKLGPPIFFQKTRSPAKSAPSLLETLKDALFWKNGFDFFPNAQTLVFQKKP